MATESGINWDALNRLQAAVPQFAAKVQPVYQLLDWRWGGEIDAHVPTYQEIEAVLYNDIQDAWRAMASGRIDPAAEWSLGSGGLELGYSPEEYGYYLAFKLEDYLWQREDSSWIWHRDGRSEDAD